MCHEFQILLVTRLISILCHEFQILLVTRLIWISDFCGHWVNLNFMPWVSDFLQWLLLSQQKQWQRSPSSQFYKVMRANVYPSWQQNQGAWYWNQVLPNSNYGLPSLLENSTQQLWISITSWKLTKSWHGSVQLHRVAKGKHFIWLGIWPFVRVQTQPPQIDLQVDRITAIMPAVYMISSPISLQLWIPSLP